jgi:hypothetical protein
MSQWARMRLAMGVLIINLLTISAASLMAFAVAALGTVTWVIFRRDASGRVVALSISQDRMWDLPFTRQPEPAAAPGVQRGWAGYGYPRTITASSSRSWP